MAINSYEISNGLTINIKPLAFEDKPVLKKAFSKLSEKSKKLRFLTSTEKLSEKEFDYLTNIDQQNHVAFAAYHHKNGEGIGIGVIRYIRSIKDLTSAEIAITIIDEFQGLGIGNLLIKEIVSFAKQQGIKTFTANAYHFNNTILNIISKYNYTITGSDNGVLILEISLIHE